MMRMAIGWSYNNSANHPTLRGTPRHPEAGLGNPGAPGDYRPAEFSASSATYGRPSRHAATCSGRPNSAR